MGAPGLAFETWDPSNKFPPLDVPKSVPQRTSVRLDVEQNKLVSMGVGVGLGGRVLQGA